MTSHGLLLVLTESVSFPELLQLLGKGFLICLLGLYLFRDMELSAAAVRNRFVVGAIICLAALPLVSTLAPAWGLPYLTRNAVFAETAGHTWVVAFIGIYMLIALAMACKLLVQIVRIAVTSMRATPAPGEWVECLNTLSGAEKIKLKISSEIPGALTWGAIRPTILIPEEGRHWSEPERELVLRHELAHIERGDWTTVLLARWVCILYWPLPGIRSLFNSLSLSAEQACDDRVLASGGNALDYASVLVKQARREQLPATLALAHPSELGIRVRYLIAEIVDRSSLDPQRRWIYPLCALLVYPLATASIVDVPKSLRIVPLNRMEHRATEIPSAPTSTAATTIAKPAPPAPVLPPPRVNLAEHIEWVGDKPSIPPP